MLKTIVRESPSGGRLIGVYLPSSGYNDFDGNPLIKSNPTRVNSSGEFTADAGGRVRKFLTELTKAGKRDVRARDGFYWHGPETSFGDGFKNLSAASRAFHRACKSHGYHEDEVFFIFPNGDVAITSPDVPRSIAGSSAWLHC